MKIIYKRFSIALFVVLCQIGIETGFSEEEGYAMGLEITNSAFDEGELIPEKYTMAKMPLLF